MVVHAEAQMELGMFVLTVSGAGWVIVITCEVVQLFASVQKAV